MRSLRALIVDDKDLNIEPIQQGLSLELEALGWHVEWNVESNSISARRLVREVAPFDFAIVDLFLNDNEIQDGIEVLREISAKDSRTYCLLVTSFSSKAPGFREAAEPYCTSAIDRMDLDRAPRWKLDRLALEIVQHLSDKGLVESARTSYDRTDHAIVSLLEHVGRAAAETSYFHQPDVDARGVLAAGERIIRNLAVRCLGRGSSAGVELSIDYVVAGKSGAQVCRIDQSSATDPRQSFILKFGFDKGALERECRANREAGKALSEQSLVRMVSDVKSDASGYHAIAARVAPGTVSLRDWLAAPASAQYASAVAEVLLGEVLGPLFARENRLAVDANEWLRPTSWDVVRSRAAIDRYSAAIEDPRAAGLGGASHALRPLSSYLMAAEYPVPAHTALPPTVVYVRAFGDLHSANVLVQGGALPRPVLVDATLYGRGHWATDSARLVVDVLLRSWCSGVDSMVWDNFSESVHLGIRLCPMSGWRESSSVAEGFISDCVRNLVTYTRAQDLGISLDDWHWQWHAALAKEFLRQACHDDLPPVRAVLGLILAARHMRLSLICVRRACPVRN